jgi:hypothetical protein
LFSDSIWFLKEERLASAGPFLCFWQLVLSATICSMRSTAAGRVFMALALSPGALLAQASNSQLHADAATFTQLSGTRAEMQANFKSMLQNARSRISKAVPQCNTAFVDEWTRRMAARMNPDDFVNVVTAAFEHHFTDVELKEMIALAKASNEKEAALPSPALKTKLDSVMPSVNSEIKTGCSALSSRLGTQIGKRSATSTRSPVSNRQQLQKFKNLLNLSDKPLDVELSKLRRQ